MVLRMVMQIIMQHVQFKKNLFNEGYCIYVDNWYTSAELCEVLKENGCDIIGTLRKDRKGLPISVVKAKMRTGQRKVSYEYKLRVMCLGWKDKRDVFLMGTCINDSLVTVKHMPPDPKLIIKCVDARFAATFGNRNSTLY